MTDIKNPGFDPVNYQSLAYKEVQYESLSFVPSENVLGTSYKDALLGKINIKDAVVGVVGLGYVGLSLAVTFAEAGFRVIGVDLNEKLVATVSRGVSHIEDISSSRLSAVIASKKLFPTCNYAKLAEADCISVCVPTPLTKSKEPDISHIADALNSLFPHIKKGMLVVLESTTYPGTTEELIAAPMNKELGFKVGESVFAAFSPERVDPGNTKWTVKNTPKLIGGVTPACTEVARALYSAALDKIHTVSSAREAETVKLLENTFRAVNIALVNELTVMCDRMNLNIWSIIEAASTKPFGFMPFYPGPGIGGHCVPLDPLYLSWKAKALDFNSKFIELATDINGNMPRFVLQKLTDILNEDVISIKGSKIMILGMAYKKNVSDIRESPGLEIFKLLKQKGAWVEYCDPHVPSLQISLSEDETKKEIISCELANCSEFDAAILTTDHKAFDYKLLAESFKIILDCRNAFANLGIVSKNIVTL